MEQNAYERFYQDTLADSNVITIESLKKELTSAGCDMIEMSKRINEIDYEKVLRSMPEELLQNGIWQLPKVGQGNKTGILKYGLEQGSIIGVGSNNKSKYLLIKGLKSKWCQHHGSYNDIKKRDLAFMDIESMVQKQQMSYQEAKKMTQGELVFEIATESNNIQTDYAVEQLKYLELIRQMIGYQLKRMYQTEVKDPKMAFILNGYTKQIYDEKMYKEELLSMSLSFNMAKAGKGNKVDVLGINPCKSEQGYDIQFQDEECVTIKDVIKMLQNKAMDIVVMIDNCFVKKDGRSYTIIPKLRILQIVLQQNTLQKKETSGLNLIKFKRD